MIQIFISHKCDGDLWLESWKDDGPGSVKATFRDANIKVVGRYIGMSDKDLTGLLLEAENLEAFAEFSKISEQNPNFLKLGVDINTLNYLASID